MYPSFFKLAQVYSELSDMISNLSEIQFNFPSKLFQLKKKCDVEQTIAVDSMRYSQFDFRYVTEYSLARTRDQIMQIGSRSTYGDSNCHPSGLLESITVWMWPQPDETEVSCFLTFNWSDTVIVAISHAICFRIDRRIAVPPITSWILLFFVTQLRKISSRSISRWHRPRFKTEFPAICLQPIDMRPGSFVRWEHAMNDDELGIMHAPAKTIFRFGRASADHRPTYHFQERKCWASSNPRSGWSAVAAASVDTGTDLLASSIGRWSDSWCPAESESETKRLWSKIVRVEFWSGVQFWFQPCRLASSSFLSNNSFPSLLPSLSSGVLCEDRRELTGKS